MALWGQDIRERQMYRPIREMFGRYYSRAHIYQEVDVLRPYALHDEEVDCLCYKACNQIHIVEAKRFVAGVPCGIDQLTSYRGNYKYLALPDGDYYEDQEYVDNMIGQRFGLVVVSRRGRGLHAEFFKNSPLFRGDFSRYYVEYIYGC